MSYTKWGKKLIRGNHAEKKSLADLHQSPSELSPKGAVFLLRPNWFLMRSLLTRQLCCKGKPHVIILFLYKDSCVQKGVFYYHFSFDSYFYAGIIGSSIAEMCRKAMLGEGSLITLFLPISQHVKSTLRHREQQGSSMNANHSFFLF